ncbi:MAG: DEAD/DEAH box helicase [Pseudomonadota bacterium]
MSEVLLNIGSDRAVLLLQGDTSAVRQNRRIWVYLEHYLRAAIVGPTEMEIPVAGQLLGPLVKNVEDTLSKHGIETKRSASLTEQIGAFLHEQNLFEEFSKRAREIWNNNLDRKEFAEFTRILDRELPSRVLYPLQLLAAYHLAFSQNAANFSVPGAGKTSVVYGAFSYLRSLAPVDPKYANKLLVVGPLSSFGPWELEFEECYGRRARSRRVSGGLSPEDRKRIYYSELSEYKELEILLTTYQSVPHDIEHIKHFLTRPANRVMVVLDEAHKIKNTEGGIWADAILQLAPTAAARVVLTGTPAPNGYQDLYNLFNFIWPGQNVLKFDLGHLRDMSQTPFDRRADILVNNIAPYFIRIRKSDLGLPAPIENAPIEVTLGDRQERIYRFIEDKYVAYFQAGNPQSWVRDTLTRARMIRLMQAATNPALLKAPLEADNVSDSDHALFVDDAAVLNQILTYEEHEAPSKLVKAVELTERLLAGSKESKVVLWCVFVDSLFRLHSMFADRGISARVLYGGTPTEMDEDNLDIETRESIIKEFESPGSSFRVVVGNPFAVGESISLHKACRNAIYVERNFNAAAFLQSKDRIHRYGLPKDASVNYFYLVARDTVDGTIHRRLLQKEAAMMKILESRDIPLLNLNMDAESEEEDVDDIAALIRDYGNRRARIQ